MVQTNIKHLIEFDYPGNLKKAIAYLLVNKDDMFSNNLGKHEVCDEFFYLIQEYESKESTVWEAHKRYIDIQIVISGEEVIEVADRDYLKSLGEYDEEKDFYGFEGKARVTLILGDGDLAILYPEDVHKPGLRSPKGATAIKKCVMKVLV